MTSLIGTLDGQTIGTIEHISAERVTVLLESDAPRATALNTGTPMGFPRINGHVLLPCEIGAIVCVISAVRTERVPSRKRGGVQQDPGLVDLPFPFRLMELVPIGTLHSVTVDGERLYRVKRGVDTFPSVGDTVILPNADQLRVLVAGEDGSQDGRVRIGHCPTAEMAPVYVNPDKLFGRHLAILGNTGSGKSCSVAGLIRWSLEGARREREKKGRSEAPNARFIVLDPNGEYDTAFADQGVRVFRVRPGDGEHALRVPAWLWNGEEWAAFTGAAPGVQRPILFEALRHLRSALGPPNVSETNLRGLVKRDHRKLVIAIQEGKRERIADILTIIKKEFEQQLLEGSYGDEVLGKIKDVATLAGDLENAARSRAKQGQPGKYWHDEFAEFEVNRVVRFLYELGDLVGLTDRSPGSDENAPRAFPVEQLPEYVEALATDQSGRDMVPFVDSMNLRIQGIFAEDRLSSVLQPIQSMTLENWLEDYVGRDGASNGAIAVLDLSLVPSEVVHVVVSVLARMVFEATQRYRRENDCNLPTTLVLEEAHTFVHRDLAGESATPAGRACAKIFERIAREGRKFGLGLVLASQRPSEVAQTVLSQCNTFLLHRLVNDRDQELVRRLVPDGLASLLRELPSLPTRRAMLLGWAAPTPTLVEILRVPEEHRPQSPDPDYWDVWTGEKERSIDWAKIAQEWQAPGEPPVGGKGHVQES